MGRAKIAKSSDGRIDPRWTVWICGSHLVWLQGTNQGTGHAGLGNQPRAQFNAPLLPMRAAADRRAYDAMIASNSVRSMVSTSIRRRETAWSFSMLLRSTCAARSCADATMRLTSASICSAISSE